MEVKWIFAPPFSFSFSRRQLAVPVSEPTLPPPRPPVRDARKASRDHRNEQHYKCCDRKPHSSAIRSACARIVIVDVVLLQVW